MIVGDSDPDIQFREDAQYITAMKLTVNKADVIGDQTEVPYYYLDAGGTNIVPDLTPAADPKAFVQLIYHAAKHFAVDVTPTHWRTRAFSETVGENRERVFSILEEIYNADNSGVESTPYE